MVSGWRYRLGSVGGTAAVTLVVVALVNHPTVQRLSMVVPLYNRLPATSLSNGALAIAVTTTLVVVLAALTPLFKPRPRRILDTLSVSIQRVLMAMIALAAIGYFDYTYRLPRTTLVMTTALLSVALPLWLVSIRKRPSAATERAVIVGDDPEAMGAILAAADLPVIGYVSPPGVDAPSPTARLADGGPGAGSLDSLECLGGLSRLDDVILGHGVDTAILAFAQPDRAEFFGALDTCYEHGVTAKVHRDHADTVLTTDVEMGQLVDVDLEPWDWQDYVFKRAFDVVFAGVGLVVLAPVMAAIAVAIKLDSPGPVLYNQRRTAAFGETFTVSKFRSMEADAEAHTGAVLSDEDGGGVDPRVTRVGRALRRTHLDEIPQLWSILVGDMSVVGPRPERPELDEDIEIGMNSWRRRWFVKPGLTGLAQINDLTGYEPEEKLRYDIAYIRRQSFWFDLKIVVRQLWKVLGDVFGVIR